MHIVQPKRTDGNTLIIHVQPWRVARGHLRLPRSGPHKDARRSARGNDRVALCRSLDR